MVRTRELKERFLIVCEGEKTEPNYFRSFRVNTKVIDINIQGKGYNTIRLVEEAVELKKRDSYDQVWCVFDRDSFPAQNFNAALTLAKNNDIKIAYSNESFELWYLLHFHFYNTGISRATYCKRLTCLLNHKYEKNSETIYDELLSRQSDAIRNAQRLLQEYSQSRPERDNPSTTVHLLVEQLNRFIH